MRTESAGKIKANQMNKFKHSTPYVLRGYSWNHDVTDYFCAHFHSRTIPGIRFYSRGFRCVLPLHKGTRLERIDSEKE